MNKTSKEKALAHDNKRAQKCALLIHSCVRFWIVHRDSMNVRCTRNKYMDVVFVYSGQTFCSIFHCICEGMRALDEYI